MKRLVIAVTTVALIVGLIACTAEPTPTQYTLTVFSTEGGDNTCVPAIGCTCGKGTKNSGGLSVPEECLCAEGTEVSILASPASGYRFIGWTGDVDTIGDVDAAETTITISGDCSITANFIAQYTLTMNSTDGGRVTSPGEGTFTYDAGTVISLSAEAEQGYKFLNWTGAIETIGNVTAASTTITVEDNYVVTGNFTLADIYFDMIGPGAWILDLNAEGISATVTRGGLLVGIASDAFGTTQTDSGCFGHSLYTLEGDFDIRTEYELITWPEHSGVRVGLIVKVRDAADKVNVERTGFGNPGHDIPHPSSEVYLVNLNETVYGIVGTSDLSGTLRVCRVGTTVTGYYDAPYGWEEIYQAEWSTEDVEVQVGVWTPGVTLFCGEEVSVLIRTVEFVEPAP